MWYDVTSEEEAEVIIYRFSRVVFGITSSPFLLSGTIRHHLEQYLESDKELIEKFLKDTYVDDTIPGCQTVEEGKKFYDRIKEIMCAAGFDLRKWVTNNSALAAYFDSKEGVSDSVSNRKGDDVTYFESLLPPNDTCNKRVLGLEWDTSMHEFVYRFHAIFERCSTMKLTKRNILSVSASIYDPLGLISPITARVKTIFQILCKDKYNLYKDCLGRIFKRIKKCKNY